MKRGVMAALAVLMVLPAAQAAAQPKPDFVNCGEEAGIGLDEARARTEGHMTRVLQQFRERWDGQYMRAQCEAYVNGESYDMSCLNGRRDWEAIEAMVPDKFYEMSRFELADPMGGLRAENPMGEALDYCRSIGAIE